MLLNPNKTQLIFGLFFFTLGLFVLIAKVFKIKGIFKRVELFQNIFDQKLGTVLHSWRYIIFPLLFGIYLLFFKHVSHRLIFYYLLGLFLSTILLIIISKKLCDKCNKIKLPCSLKGFCPYEYKLEPERDIEGMPFPIQEDDPRRCPEYGHICPEFMQDFGLSVEDLNIRAVIHAGFAAEGLIKTGEKQMTPELEIIISKYQEYLKKYQPDQCPQYY